MANNILLAVNDLADLILPINNISRSGISANIRRIDFALERKEAVVFFPAGEVSRLSLRGIIDASWQTGAMRFAQRHKTPILPLYVNAKNSALFYGISLLSKKVSVIFLPREMFRKKSKPIRSTYW